MFGFSHHCLTCFDVPQVHLCCVAVVWVVLCLLLFPVSYMQLRCVVWHLSHVYVVRCCVCFMLLLCVTHCVVPLIYVHVCSAHCVVGPVSCAVSYVHVCCAALCMCTSSYMCMYVVHLLQPCGTFPSSTRWTLPPFNSNPFTPHSRYHSDQISPKSISIVECDQCDCKCGNKRENEKTQRRITQV